MAMKAINEKFTIAEWNYINSVKEKFGMTWAGFLPHAAKCADNLFLSLSVMYRIGEISEKGESFEDVIKRLLDSWDEYQKERDDGR